MSALRPGRRFCFVALWCRTPPAGRARNLRIPEQLQHCIKYCNSQQGDGGGGRPEAPTFTPSALGIKRRRSLSPLDRLRGLIPPECISQELRDLQGSELSSSHQDHLSPSSSHQDHLSPSSSHQDHLSPSSSHQDHLSPPSSHQDHLSPPSSHQDHLSPPSSQQESTAPGSPEPLSSASLQQNNVSPNLRSPPESPSLVAPFQPGDLLIAEYKKRYYTMFRKMFILKNSGKLVTTWGAIDYKELLGRLPGERVRMSSGQQLLVKRPSLDEYVLHMRRGPTISYPKDAAAMLLMMDVNPGDVILEAGSGSGALSLFLSRAVGPEGCIHSVEVRSDHHYASRKNFLTWKSAWEFGSGRRWPDNVNFIKKDVLDAMSDLKAVAFDAVALDMLNPQVVLPGIVRNLKQGAVCAVYVVNITQVIDLLEGIRSCQLPLICEKVMEVSVTNWLVAPLLRKDGRISKRVTPQCNLTAEGQTQDQSDDDDGQTEEDDSVIGSRPFGQLPYIARPLPWQVGHTAFLVQLRKCKATAEATERGAPR